MSPTTEFTKVFLQQYKKMLPKLDNVLDQAGEVDQRYSFARTIVEGVWKYDHDAGDFDFEALKVRTDIPIYDRDHNKVIVIETKRSTVQDEDLTDYSAQAFGYANEFTRYVLLTNFRRFILYSNDKRRTVLADINVYFILVRGSALPGGESVTLDEDASIAQLRFLGKGEAWDPKRFDDFAEPFQHRGNVADPGVLSDLASTLERSMEYLYTYALKAFDEYAAAYEAYTKEQRDIVYGIEQAEKARDQGVAAGLAERLRDLEVANKLYVEFYEGYRLWEALAGRRLDEKKGAAVASRREQNKEVFCRESAYVQLNKILFVRICEDKGLLPRKLSNGGVDIWRTFTRFLRDEFKDLLRVAFSDALRLYESLYLKGIFDWYLEGNSQLNHIFKRVLWLLNHFDFATVNDDILGGLYEAYLPKETRKALGGFYTQKPIVDFILDNVGWTADRELRGTKLLDMGAGSGTFLVSATQRFFKSLPQGIPSGDALDMAIDAIHGFDIDPFATHICEMNLIFQVLDRYRVVKESDPQRMLKPLNVYNTDSLEIPEPRQITLSHAESEAILSFVKRRTSTEKAKADKYDFVVGNPPYVTYNIPPDKRTYYRRTYEESIYNRLNLYRLFVHRASQVLKDGGRLGYIIPNTWIADMYARKFRAFLLPTFRIKKVVPIPESVKAFFGVTQATTIVVLEKKPAASSANYDIDVGEEISAIEDLRNIKWTTRKLAEASFGEDYEWAFVFHHDDLVYGFIRQVMPGARPGLVRLDSLNDVEEIKSGEVRQADVRGNIFSTPAEGRYAAIVGDNVDHFFIDVSDRRRSPLYYGRPKQGDQIPRDDLSRTPRIIVQNIINQASKRRITAGYVNPEKGRIYAENLVSYVLLRQDSKVDPYYLLGLLNSSTLDFFAKLFSSTNHVQPHEIKRLPICVDPLNADLMREIAAIARTIEERKRKLNDLTLASSDPAHLHKGIGLVGIFHSPMIKGYPPAGLTGVPTVRQEGSRVYVTLEHSFECQDASVASYLARRLTEIKDLSELPTLKVPKDKSGIEEGTRRLEELNKDLLALPAEIARLMSKLDEATFDLYDIESHTREMVRRRVREGSVAGGLAEEPEVSDTESEA